MEFCPYRLPIEAPISSQSREEVIEGLLLKEGNFFSVFQKWPATSWEIQEMLLKQHHLSELKSDFPFWSGRYEDLLLQYGYRFDDGDCMLARPRVHISGGSLASHDRESLERLSRNAQMNSDSLVKFKMGVDLPKERELLLSALDLPFRLRMDFSNSLSYHECHSFLESLPLEVIAQIDCLEDPCEYSDRDWAALKKEFEVLLASDFQKDKSACHEADYWVVKISQNFQLELDLALTSNKKILITSNMEHPIGEAYAYFMAAHWQQQFGEQFVEAGVMPSLLYRGSGPAILHWNQFLNETEKTWSDVDFQPFLQEEAWQDWIESA